MDEDDGRVFQEPLLTNVHEEKPEQRARMAWSSSPLLWTERVGLRGIRPEARQLILGQGQMLSPAPASTHTLQSFTERHGDEARVPGQGQTRPQGPVLHVP